MADYHRQRSEEHVIYLTLYFEKEKKFPVFAISKFVSVDAGHGHTTMQVRGQHCCGRYVALKVLILLLFFSLKKPSFHEEE